ncbi:DUF1835 domain-containing protein [Clostridium ganghwense]|uniref:DUF1835 domain-containing protein n=1 Tax=Clostridium ganghwense TaxID=312089 RepID=A0ABT4CT39_9CLOT|nr:DUF1835 domain-containing protein [Clostridium ganghwense]MCY6372219.1 DUF1835 domain-containing protein [Clostridium ganghwense]
MSKYVHIVFGDSARGSLRYFIENNPNEYNGSIIGIREDYSIGPIYEIETEVGMIKRIEYFTDILKKVSAYEYLEHIKEDFIEIHEDIRNIEQDSKIVIWHGENTNDQVGLRCLVSLLKNRDLYEVNVSESYVRGYNDNEYIPRALAECSPEEIHNIISKIKKIDKERCNNLIDDWEVLRNSKENLRILKDNKIVGVDESYYDNDILYNCTLSFRKAARIIGDTMGKSEQLVGDLYIDYRVRKLIESGKIEYRGKLAAMREFEARLIGDLNEFFSDIFNMNCEIDGDGFYHYLLEEKDDNLEVDTTHITKWDTVDLSNKLILDYNEDNLFSLSWFKEGRNLISINHIRVSNIEYRTEEYEDNNGELVREEAIIIFADSLLDRYLEIKIRPYISVSLRIDFKNFDD